MGDWAGVECFADVIKIASKQEPCSTQRGESRENREGEEEADDARRGLRVRAEDVVDFGFAAVAFWCGWRRWRGAWIGLNGKVESVLVEWRGGAKRSDDDGGLEWTFARCKLVWEVLRALRGIEVSILSLPRVYFKALHTTSTLPFPFSFKLKGNDSSSPVAGSCRVKNAWCGRLPALSSVVVRTILRLSEAGRVMAELSGEVGDSLDTMSAVGS